MYLCVCVCKLDNIYWQFSNNTNVRDVVLTIKGLPGDYTKILRYPCVRGRLRIDENSPKDQEYIHLNLPISLSITMSGTAGQCMLHNMMQQEVMRAPTVKCSCLQLEAETNHI